jgi:hypothetical protein
VVGENPHPNFGKIGASLGLEHFWTLSFLGRLSNSGRLFDYVKAGQPARQKVIRCPKRGKLNCARAGSDDKLSAKNPSRFMLTLVENRDEWGSLFRGSPIKIKDQDGMGQPPFLAKNARNGAPARKKKNLLDELSNSGGAFDYIVKAG